MAKTRAIVKRRKAIRNIRKITRTMELIATARFKKALDRAVEAEAYTRKIAELAADLSASAANVQHPLHRRVHRRPAGPGRRDVHEIPQRGPADAGLGNPTAPVRRRRAGGRPGGGAPAGGRVRVPAWRRQHPRRNPARVVQGAAVQV